MSNFNNKAYQSLVADLIGDTFYKETSVSGRISFVRKYAEVVILTTLIISKKPGNTGISRDIRTEFTTDLLLSD